MSRRVGWAGGMAIVVRALVQARVAAGLRSGDRSTLGKLPCIDDVSPFQHEGARGRSGDAWCLGSLGERRTDVGLGRDVRPTAVDELEQAVEHCKPGAEGASWGSNAVVLTARCSRAGRRARASVRVSAIRNSTSSSA